LLALSKGVQPDVCIEELTTYIHTFLNMSSNACDLETFSIVFCSVQICLSLYLSLWFFHANLR